MYPHPVYDTLHPCQSPLIDIVKDRSLSLAAVASKKISTVGSSGEAAAGLLWDFGASVLDRYVALHNTAEY